MQSIHNTNNGQKQKNRNTLLYYMRIADDCQNMDMGRGLARLVPADKGGRRENQGEEVKIIKCLLRTFFFKTLPIEDKI